MRATLLQVIVGFSAAWLTCTVTDSRQRPDHRMAGQWAALQHPNFAVLPQEMTEILAEWGKEQVESGIYAIQHCFWGQRIAQTGIGSTLARGSVAYISETSPQIIWALMQIVAQWGRLHPWIWLPHTGSITWRHALAHLRCICISSWRTLVARARSVWAEWQDRGVASRQQRPSCC